MKLPCRGFSNARFQKKYDVINLGQIDAAYSDKEVVNMETLKSHGFIGGKTNGIKILGKGELTKKVASIEVHALSEGAREKLHKLKIPVTLLKK
jgi:large subunit ribosomal protein L15